jgi:lysozyme
MAIKKRSIFYAGSAVAVALFASVAKWEGVRYTAYLDVVGVPTICYGETRGVKMGQRKTREECDAMLEPRLKEFEKQVLACTNVELPEKTQAAFVHFAYNVGGGAYCKGSVAREANKGNLAGACDNLKKYIYAKGKVYRGLVNRRNAEHRLCMEGVKEGVNALGYVHKLASWVRQSFTG